MEEDKLVIQNEFATKDIKNSIYTIPERKNLWDQLNSV